MGQKPSLSSATSTARKNAPCPAVSLAARRRTAKPGHILVRGRPSVFAPCSKNLSADGYETEAAVLLQRGRRARMRAENVFLVAAGRTALQARHAGDTRQRRGGAQDLLYFPRSAAALPPCRPPPLDGTYGYEGRGFVLRFKVSSGRQNTGSGAGKPAGKPAGKTASKPGK